MRSPFMGLVFIGWFSALGACASSGATAQPEAPKAVEEESFDDADRVYTEIEAAALESACWEAIVAESCQVAMSAEGEQASSCTCQGEARGGHASMLIQGTREDGSEFQATYDLVDGDDGWKLGDRQ